MIGPWPSGRCPCSGQPIGTSVVRGASAQASHLVAMPEGPASIGSTAPRKSRVGSDAPRSARSARASASSSRTRERRWKARRTSSK